jgi:hypothetical protein
MPYWLAPEASPASPAPLDVVTRHNPKREMQRETDVSEFARGQEVVVGGRAAYFVEMHVGGAAVVRFAGEKASRGVPMRNLAAKPLARGTK